MTSDERRNMEGEIVTLQLENSDLAGKIMALLEQLKPMQHCGHPRIALNPDGDTRYCRWCADIANARADERAAIITVCLDRAQQWEALFATATARRAKEARAIAGILAGAEDEDSDLFAAARRRMP